MASFFHTKLDQNTSNINGHNNEDDWIVIDFFLEKGVKIGKAKLKEELDNDLLHFVVGER